MIELTLASALIATLLLYGILLMQQEQPTNAHRRRRANPGLFGPHRLAAPPPRRRLGRMVRRVVDAVAAHGNGERDRHVERMVQGEHNSRQVLAVPVPRLPATRAQRNHVEPTGRTFDEDGKRHNGVADDDLEPEATLRLLRSIVEARGVVTPDLRKYRLRGEVKVEGKQGQDQDEDEDDGVEVERDTNPQHEQRLFTVPTENLAQVGLTTWAIIDPESCLRPIVPEIRVDEVEEEREQQEGARRRVRFNEEMRMQSFGGREYVGRVVDKEQDGETDRDEEGKDENKEKDGEE